MSVLVAACTRASRRPTRRHSSAARPHGPHQPQPPGRRLQAQPVPLRGPCPPPSSARAGAVRLSCAMLSCPGNQPQGTWGGARVRAAGRQAGGRCGGSPVGAEAHGARSRRQKPGARAPRSTQETVGAAEAPASPVPRESGSAHTAGCGPGREGQPDAAAPRWTRGTRGVEPARGADGRSTRRDGERGRGAGAGEGESMGRGVRLGRRNSPGVRGAAQPCACRRLGVRACASVWLGVRACMRGGTCVHTCVRVCRCVRAWGVCAHVRACAGVCACMGSVCVHTCVHVGVCVYIL